MYPKVNQNIVIEVKDRDKSFRSIVADIGKKEMLIGIPLDRENIGLIMDGTALDIFFLSGDNQYKFSTKMVGKTKDKIPLYRVIKPQEQEIVKIQRRDNFRVKTSLRLVLNETELTTVDLSVGGVLFANKSDFEVKKGEMVSGTLFIPNKHNKVLDLIPFEGLVKRIDIIEDPEQERKNTAIEFISVKKHDQMKITQYCFERQRQIRLKERNSL